MIWIQANKIYFYKAQFSSLSIPPLFSLLSKQFPLRRKG